MINWKSNIAFFVFIGLFVWTVINNASEGIVDITGTIALIATTLMMFRSKITSDIIMKLVENIKIGK